MPDFFDKYGRYSGGSSSAGNRYDENGVCGYSSDDGTHYGLNHEVTGHSVKGVNDNTMIHYDEHGGVVGYTDETGRTINQYGEYIGTVDVHPKSHKNNRSGSSRKAKQSGGCYLTTACSEYKGLTDDCYELTTLRKFRDSYMKENYKSDIDEYYKIAPSILEKVNYLNTGEKEVVYNNIYSIVKNCCEFIDNNQYNKAYTEYKTMVNYLSKRFL